MSKADLEERALEAIKDYLLKQNRPYSAVDVTANLHKEFGKTLVVKVLDSLVESKHLKEKTLSKQKIYYPNQDNFPSFDDTELRNLDCEIQKETEALKDVQESKKRLENELRHLESALPTPELENQVLQLKSATEDLQKKVDGLRGSTQKVDPKEKNQIMKNRECYVKEWRKRKRMADEMVCTILENCPKKKKDLLEEIGIETDEDAKVTLP